MSDLLANDLIVADTGASPLLELNDVTIVKAAPVGRLSFRARDAALKDAGAAFGVALPGKPLSSNTASKRAALWMGPDEWTLVTPEDDLRPVFDNIVDKLGDTPNALVDVSHRSDAIIVSGDKAAWLLNNGIFIDFSIEAFPVGTVTRTIFHKSPVTVWRTGPDTFMVEAWVSFMDYVSGLLIQAAQELQAA